jgi:hypothetical protein
MMTLFAQYYVPDSKERAAELNQCFERNIKNDLVSKFIIYFEKQDDMNLIPDNQKIIKKYHPYRMTYSYWLKETEQQSVGTLCVLINSDIYLTKSIDHLIKNTKVIQEEKKFIALTRFNPINNEFELNSNPHWCQDTWALVKGNVALPSALLQEAAFELGQPGCDNKIAYVMHSYGFALSNPCYEVCTVHLQKNTTRSYDSKDSKLIGLHAFVHPVQSVVNDSVIDIDLLTRNSKDPVEIRVNNWINGRKTYNLTSAQLSTSKIGNQELLRVSIDQLKIRKTRHELGIPELKPLISKRKIPTAEFQSEKYKLIAKFSERFLIYQEADILFFYDKYWPTVWSQSIADMGGISLDEKNPILFAEAFLPTVLEVECVGISNDMQYPEDIMFWQYPCITERDAYERHSKIKSRSYSDKVINTYLPIPWATFIDKKKFASAYLQILSSRIQAATRILKKMGYETKIHTVCQHIRWRNLENWISRIGVTDLWISHKEKGLNYLGNIRLHPWSLYAVNYCDKSRSRGLEVKPVSEKKYFASFIGAHMKHYPTDVRLRLNELSSLPGYLVEVKDLWHFNKVVYNYQVNAQEDHKNAIEEDEVRSYNEVLSNSIFSLCPAGAGPNTLRLWESLAIGSIPVVISDNFELPSINGNIDVKWDEIIVFHPEKEIFRLNDRLKEYDLEKLKKMQKLSLEVFRKIQQKTIFEY